MDLQLRSGGEHSDPESLCGFGREHCAGGNNLILSLLFGTGGEYCDHELAVEVRRTKEEGGGRRRKVRSRADIKSNNPHLTGGEKLEKTS